MIISAIDGNQLSRYSEGDTKNIPFLGVFRFLFR